MAGKTYSQFCGLARSLDVVGDRWSLLIVRELLVGPARFGELRAGLPGIATNLLAERLKELQRRGVIERHLAGEANAARYALTEWGARLAEPVGALIRWSTPLMAGGRRDDSFQPHWLVPALAALLTGRRSRRRATLVLIVEDTPIEITVDSNGTHVRLARDPVGDKAAVLRASAQDALALAAGAAPRDDAIDYTGDPAVLRTVLGR